MVFKAGLGFSGKLPRRRRFYEEHPRWLYAQVFVILLLAALGVVALFVATWLGVVLLIVSFACSIAALNVPAWRVRVEERHPEA